MNIKTFSKYYSSLTEEISAHPNKDELLNIMSQQLEDDTSVIDVEFIPIKAA
tara:strand:- start:696 stop:851 length:156 start_codon:yes stop_codon:yes gene_type:complete